jgi:hypothetical protein
LQTVDKYRFSQELVNPMPFVHVRDLAASLPAPAAVVFWLQLTASLS